MFSKEDIVINSSLTFPTRLIFVKTKYMEGELKQNLSLKNISINRQIFPFGLKVLIRTRVPIAYGEILLNGEKKVGFFDEDGFFIDEKYTDKKNLEITRIEVIGWEEKFRKTLSTILTSQKNYDFELNKIIFSKNGFLTLEEKDLQVILCGFNKSLIESQLQIISNLKNQIIEKSIIDKIDNIDITDPNNPKIKVFKP